MNEQMKAAGESLRSALQPFHEAQGKRLTAVFQTSSDEGEEMLLAFGAEGLVFQCDADTDLMTLRWGALSDPSEADDLTDDPAWSKYIGKEFFWGWITINQQGYADGMLLSFDGVVPEIGLNVVASEFEILDIRQRAQ